MTRTPILYIAGSGRSGSTLLGVLLGQLPGFCAVGEARDLFDLGIGRRGPCGCGLAVPDCPFWKSVLRRTFPQSDVNPTRWANDKERFLRTKRILSYELRHRFDLPTERSELLAYVHTLRRLYAAIRDESSAKVIVDASKWPTYGKLLESIDELDVYVVHLVRDPRACAAAWSKAKQVEANRRLETQNAAFTTSYWVAWNGIIPRWFDRSRYLLLRYEDFVSAPRDSIRRVATFVGHSEAALPFVDDRIAELGPTHSIAGNDGRFSRGRLEIRASDDWRIKLPARSRRLVELMTFALRRKYGYE
ncbi:MAG: sulfotransferase [Deltaproteobacteria bacterium]|nr:sulfotransferase [Deltaproteobacteria bacterium]